LPPKVIVTSSAEPAMRRPVPVSPGW
jgi:hypothetical protein